MLIFSHILLKCNLKFRGGRLGSCQIDHHKRHLTCPILCVCVITPIVFNMFFFTFVDQIANHDRAIVKNSGVWISGPSACLFIVNYCAITFKVLLDRSLDIKSIFLSYRNSYCWCKSKIYNDVSNIKMMWAKHSLRSKLVVIGYHGDGNQDLSLLFTSLTFYFFVKHVASHCCQCFPIC